MEKMPLNQDVFQYYSTNDVTKLLSIDDLLKDVNIISKDGQMKKSYCAIGTK